jgi:hypothetical protein
MAEPDELEDLHRGCVGKYDEKLLGWRLRLSRAVGRVRVAESQLKRCQGLEERGKVDQAVVRTAELELAAAVGAAEFCRLMERDASASAKPAQPNGGKRP